MCNNGDSKLSCNNPCSEPQYLGSIWLVQFKQNVNQSIAPKLLPTWWLGRCLPVVVDQVTCEKDEGDNDSDGRRPVW